MKVSFINGLCTTNDAISSSLRNQISWIMEHPEFDARLYTYRCDYPDLPFKIVKNLNDVAFDSFFQDSEVVIFHFGIYYPLFNLLPVSPRNSKKVVIFHNITPKLFLPMKDHYLIEKSFSQLSNLAFADHIICDSQINYDAVSSVGITVPCSIIPLSIEGDPSPPKKKPSFVDGVSRIVFIGRFVRSKGPIDLLKSLERVVTALPNIPIKASFIGNLEFSDDEIFREMTAIASKLTQNHSRLDIELFGSATDLQKNRVLGESDLFVLPTYHEGFCVPILEAMRSGCLVVSYDNSNIPYVSGGLAHLIPTGDIGLLSNAIIDDVQKTRSIEWIKEGYYNRYTTQTVQHVQFFNPKKMRDMFMSILYKIIIS